jgi:hypothetical protein
MLGRRYVCDFTVVAMEAGPGGGTVTLEMYGELYQISLEELQVLVERGLVVEAGGES